MLEFAEVSKSFWTGERRKVILDRATFTVELGYSLGILAPNGTGKTTLIRMMAGLELPTKVTSIATAASRFRWASWVG
jgi:capsular polysaccharide transport system ATP-binding protein